MSSAAAIEVVRRSGLFEPNVFARWEAGRQGSRKAGKQGSRKAGKQGNKEAGKQGSSGWPGPLHVRRGFRGRFGAFATSRGLPDVSRARLSHTKLTVRSNCSPSKRKPRSTGTRSQAICAIQGICPVLRRWQLSHQDFLSSKSCPESTLPYMTLLNSFSLDS